MNNYYDHYINIGILGPVSSGKSTLLCGMCGNSYTEINKRACTKNIQVYMTMKEGECFMDSSDILSANRSLNAKISELQLGKNFVENNCGEITHYIRKNANIINSLDNIGYRIYDTFGLNGENDFVNEIYVNVIIKLIAKLNIIILVFDSNDTITSNNGILNFIMDEIKKYDDKELIIVLNKCDKIDYDENNLPLYESDDKIIVDAINLCATNKKISNYKCIPICGTHIYVNRLLENRLHDTISDTLLDNFIDIEMGRSGHVYKTRDEKISKLNDLSINRDDVMRRNGYKALINNIDIICTKALFNMLSYNEWNDSKLTDVCFNEKYVNSFRLFIIRITEIKKICNYEGPYPQYIIKFIDEVFDTLTNVSHVEIFNKYKFIKKPANNIIDIIDVFKNLLIKTQITSCIMSNYITEIRHIRDMYEVMFETNKKHLCSVLNDSIDKHIENTNELMYAAMNYKLNIIYDYKTAAYLFANNKIMISNLDSGVNNYYNGKRLKYDTISSLSNDICNTLSLYKDYCSIEKVMDIYLMIMKLLISKKNTKTILYLKYWLTIHCKCDFNDYQNHIYSSLYMYIEKEISKYDIYNLDDLTFTEKKQHNEMLHLILITINSEFFGNDNAVIDSHRSNTDSPTKDLESEISLSISELNHESCNF